MARLPLALVAALPLLYLSWGFLQAWRQPLLPANRPFIDGVFLMMFMEGFMIFATLFIFSLVFVEKRLIRVLWLVGISVPFAVGLYVFALGLERPDIGALYYLVLALWEVGFALWPAKPAKMAG